MAKSFMSGMLMHDCYHVLPATASCQLLMVFYIILVECDVYDSTSTQERLYADMKYPSNFVMTSIQIVVDGRLLSQLVST